MLKPIITMNYQYRSEEQNLSNIGIYWKKSNYLTIIGMKQQKIMILILDTQYLQPFLLSCFFQVE